MKAECYGQNYLNVIHNFRISPFFIFSLGKNFGHLTSILKKKKTAQYDIQYGHHSSPLYLSCHLLLKPPMKHFLTIGSWTFFQPQTNCIA